MYETGCYRGRSIVRKIINLLQDDWLSKQFTKKDCKTGRISMMQYMYWDRSHRTVLQIENIDMIMEHGTEHTYVRVQAQRFRDRIASDSRAGLHS